MEKIIQPTGWTGGEGLDVFDVLDPYALRHGELEKVATSGVHPDVYEYIYSHVLNIHPMNDRYMYALCSNMGAGETWGSNVNADRFLRSVLAYTGKDWGIETFKTAGIYKHHLNKDPKKSYGDIDFVVFASAPKYLDRVESIVKLDRERAAKVGAEDVIEAIGRGEFPAWSMGARVPHDVCSYCGNKAKTRKEYCIHMKRYPNTIITADFYGRKGFENLTPEKLGLRICVDNPRPKFFDFSRVWIGAANEAKTLLKVANTSVRTSAELAEYLMKDAADKDAADKNATIHKRIDGDQSGPIGKSMKVFSQHEPSIPTDMLNALGSAGLPQALATTSSMGMILKPKEFQRVALVSRGNHGLADIMDNMGMRFPDTNKVTNCHEQLAHDHFLKGLANMLLGMVSNRSSYGPAINKRIIRITIKKPSTEDRFNDTPDMRKLSALYNGYRLAALEKIASGAEMFSDFPELYNVLYSGELSDLSSGLSKQAEPLVSRSTIAYTVHAYGSNISNMIQSSPELVTPTLRRAAQALQ